MSRSSAITLGAVSDVQLAANGTSYFAAAFKRGLLGKAATRTFWSTTDDQGHEQWERIAPEELAALKGRDLSGEVFIEAVEIEPEEFVVPDTGEVKTLTSRTIVRFADETPEQATRRMGSLMRGHREAESSSEGQDALSIPPAALYGPASNGWR